MRHALPCVLALLAAAAFPAAASADDPVEGGPAKEAAQEEGKPAAGPEPEEPEDAEEEEDGEEEDETFLERDTLTGDWYGCRTRRREDGLEFRAAWLEDFTRVQHGGIDPHEDSRRYWLDVEASFDLGVLGAEGWKATAAFWQLGGEYGTADVGAFNEISGYESPEFRQQVAEGYLEWTGLAEGLRLKAGKFDASNEFAWSDYANDFLNLGVAWPPNLLAMPVYPDPAFGAMAAWEPEEGFYGSVALMDGALQEGKATGERGASTLFGEPSDLYGILEGGANLDLEGNPLRAFLGAWGHNGEFAEFSGGVTDDAWGWYAGVEGRVPGTGREDDEDERGVYVSLRLTAADGDVAAVERHWVAAAVWQGPLPSREDDAAGLAWVYGDLADGGGTGFRRGFEQVLEGYYKVQVTGFLSLTPSVQYIANPGGVHPDALVLGARLVIEF